MSREESSHIAALIERLGRLTVSESHSHGLKPVQWEVLRYLDRANRFSNTAMAVTAYLGLTKGTVSQSIKSLEAKGLVRKQADPHDRRNVRLFLTAAARRLLARDPMLELEAAAAQLASPARRKLTQSLEQLLSRRLAARDRRAFGVCRECRYFARHHPQGAPHRCQLLEETLTEPDASFICYEQVAS